MATTLVVDDDPTARDLIVTVLGYAGHDLRQAADGAEALIHVQATPPDLVVADLMMPTMDGFEFVHRLRENHGLALTPAMFYTATYLESEARCLASACGVTHIITKPAEPPMEISVADLPDWQADPMLLQQVFTNLLSNAVKYTRDCDPAAIEIGWLADGGQGVYFVKDNGAGFDMKYAGNHGQPDASGLPKVIILDLKLPEVDGLEVLRQLKSDPRTAPIPVVVFSLSQEERDLVMSYKLGANSYIVKPVDFDEFAESVRMVSKYWLQLNQIPKPSLIS